ncbi:hypothetical protein [Methylomonas fluvii]|nr:hypothetical protein [Methylomonas fluvii]
MVCQIVEIGICLKPSGIAFVETNGLRIYASAFIWGHYGSK